jgi:hypothetical protein
LIDPSSASVRSTPREERDLFISATNAWVPVFDNLSGISPWLSDALCRISTGAGFSTRKLYANDEEAIFQVCRPVILNGIGEQATRSDLLDRSVSLELEAITEEARRDEQSFWAEFEEKRPFILGALLDAVAHGMRNIAGVQLTRQPRMADFGRWVTAVEGSFGWEPETILNAYRRSMERAQARIVEADPTALLILQLLEEKRRWEGSWSKLRDELWLFAESHHQKLPPTANALSGAVKRVEPALQYFGVTVERSRKGAKGERHVKLQMM